MSNALRETIVRNELVKVNAVRPPGSTGPTPDPFTLYFWPPDLKGSYEEMTPNSNGGRQTWKSFEHYKFECDSTNLDQAVDATFSIDHIGYRNWYYHRGVVRNAALLFNAHVFEESGAPIKGLPAFRVATVAGNIIPEPLNLDSWVKSSLMAMLPVIKGELSLVNSVLELKDFLSLPRTVLHVKEVLLSAIKPGRKTIREILRASSDSYLQYKFNIAPLISDIVGIYRAVQRTERRINDFVSRSGRVRLCHWTKPFTEYVNTSEVNQSLCAQPFSVLEKPGWAGMDNCYDRSERVVVNSSSVFHAQIQYNYNYTGYQVEHARILALLDALGVNLNPAIIWNAIPWSFVVDWVLGVSRWLSDQRVGLMDPKINILRYLWSIKRERRIYVTSRIGCSIRDGYPNLLVWSSIVRPSVRETSYRRQVGLPLPSSITSSGLSSTEFSLGAALVLSRGRHHNRMRNR